MKNIKFLFGIRKPALFFLSLLCLNGCTKSFESFNTDSNGVSAEQLIPDNNDIGSFFPMLQYAIVPNHGTFNTQGVLGEYHISAPFAGYATEAYPEEAPGLSYNFSGWSNYMLFGLAYNGVMGPVNHLRNYGAPATAPDLWAIALILQAAKMHKITDIHGPIPFSRYGIGGVTVPYDSQQSIYLTLFAQLDTAAHSLRQYIASFPGAKPFQRFDKVYNGDYTKWLKYANSLRLRLAMHIVKIDPALAKEQALIAIDPANGGVLASNADNAATTGGNNLLWSASWQWNTLRAGAAIICYMDGYNDPRISKYFAKSTSSLFPTQYVGIKTGSVIHNYAQALGYSAISNDFTDATPGIMMTVSEVNFLLAEGALRGWNMGQSAQYYYEEGIRTSMQQWKIEGGDANNYISNAVDKCKDFIDPLEPLNNSPALSDVTISWDDADSNERKLEKIITQKWIALFPDGTEGWANFRRTGYPKLFPITESQNHSGGTIDTDIQIRRQPYPIGEYANNASEVEKALLLLGGPDNGGTRVWWDVAGPNF